MEQEVKDPEDSVPEAADSPEAVAPAESTAPATESPEPPAPEPPAPAEESAPKLPYSILDVKFQEARNRLAQIVTICDDEKYRGKSLSVRQIIMLLDEIKTVAAHGS